MTRQEAFRILELPDGTDRSQIRNAYSEKVKIYHVETHPEEFARLHEAYKTALRAGTRNYLGNTDFFSRPRAHFQTDPARWNNPSLTDDEHSEGPLPPENAFSDDPLSQENAFSNDPFSQENAFSDNPLSRENAFSDDPLSQENAFSDDPLSRKNAPADTQAPPPRSPYEDILDSLVEENPFSITRCLELTRLIYYKLKYMASSAPAENLPDDDMTFFQIPWRDWKDLEWILLICHPDFIRKQHSYDFLAQLYDFLQEESIVSPCGIGQEFYFALCTAYGFFLSAQDQEPRSAMLQAVLDLLSAHPRHKEYARDLQQWENLQADRRLVLLCQEAVHYSQGKGMSEDRQAFAESFLDRAEILLMDEATPKNEFILQNLICLPDELFSRGLSERKRNYQHMQKALFDEFTTAFDPTLEGHSLSDADYIPVARRLAKLKEKYMPQGYWSRIIRSSGFMLSLKNWLRPQGCRLSLNYYFPYDVWREIRRLFDDDAPFQKRYLIWMQTEAHFSEYEKRYQQELLWRRQHIEDAYFQETFPLPRMNLKKHQLLFTVHRGTPVGIGEMPSLLKGLYRHDKSSLRFFERLTAAMVHFNFLLIAPSYEKDPVPDDIICFLKDEVILYRKKEKLTCHLRHAVFYDHLARAFDSLAECYNYKSDKQSLYSEEFINTSCKNMYYYDCFVHSMPPAGGD